MGAQYRLQRPLGHRLGQIEPTAYNHTDLVGYMQYFVYWVGLRAVLLDGRRGDALPGAPGFPLPWSGMCRSVSGRTPWVECGVPPDVGKGGGHRGSTHLVRVLYA